MQTDPNSKLEAAECAKRPREPGWQGEKRQGRWPANRLLLGCQESARISVNDTAELTEELRGHLGRRRGFVVNFTFLTSVPARLRAPGRDVNIRANKLEFLCKCVKLVTLIVSLHLFCFVFLILL